MANYCCDYKILAAENTLAPSNVFTTGYTNLTWGYNRGMAKTSGSVFQPSSSEIVQAPIFEPFTPEQERLFLEELQGFNNFPEIEYSKWGNDDTETSVGI